MGFSITVDVYQILFAKGSWIFTTMEYLSAQLHSNFGQVVVLFKMSCVTMIWQTPVFNHQNATKVTLFWLQLLLNALKLKKFVNLVSIPPNYRIDLYWMAFFTQRTCLIQIQLPNSLETNYWWQKRKFTRFRLNLEQQRSKPVRTSFLIRSVIWLSVQWTDDTEIQ